MKEIKVFDFTVLIEKDKNGYYTGSVPSLKGCHTQGKTVDELMKNIKEAVELCLETPLHFGSVKVCILLFVKLEYRHLTS